MEAFFWCAVVVLIVWGLFALGTQSKESKPKKSADKPNERGGELWQALFWIVIIVGFVAVVATSNS